MERYSLSLHAPSEDFPKITVSSCNGNRLMALDRDSAELLIEQLITLVDAIKALEAIDYGDANGESV